MRVHFSMLSFRYCENFTPFYLLLFIVKFYLRYFFNWIQSDEIGPKPGTIAPLEYGVCFKVSKSLMRSAKGSNQQLSVWQMSRRMSRLGCLCACMSNLILWILSYGLLDSHTRIPTQFTGLAIRNLKNSWECGHFTYDTRVIEEMFNVQFSFLLGIEIAENLFSPSGEWSLFMLFIVLTRPWVLKRK